MCLYKILKWREKKAKLSTEDKKEETNKPCYIVNNILSMNEKYNHLFSQQKQYNTHMQAKPIYIKIHNKC